MVRTLGCLLVSAGLALAAFSAYMLAGSNVAGDRASAQILELASETLQQSPAATTAPPSAALPTPAASMKPPLPMPREDRDGGAAGGVTTAVPAAVGQAVALAHGDLIGVVAIPSIDVEVPVLEGMDAPVLDQGVLGHYPGAADPGQVGNFAVAGHRTTHGAPLYDIDRIAVGDPIVVETSQGWDVYTMQRQRVVKPDAVEVLAAVPDHPEATPSAAWMVLTSCHPKLSAAKRIVAYALLDRHVPRASGPPAEVG